MSKFLVVILVVVSILGLVFPAVASVKYDVAEAVIGDAGAFPVKRGFIEERLGKPDFTESAVGFPAPLEVYVVEDSDELSHIFLVYGAGEDGNESYAMGAVMKGIDFATMMGMLDIGGENASMVILRGEKFVVLDIVGVEAPQVLWGLFEERTFQGETHLVSILIPPTNLVPYFASVYKDFEEPLKKAIAERIKGK